MTGTPRRDRPQTAAGGGPPRGEPRRDGRGTCREPRQASRWPYRDREGSCRDRRDRRRDSRERGHDLRRFRRPAERRDRGVAALEFLGMLPFLLLIALAGIQLGIVAYCGEQAGTAARTAARTAAQPDPHADPATAGQNAVSGWVDPAIGFPTDDTFTVTATATVVIPSVLPGVSFFDPVTRSATMPKEDTTP